ncbi:hypothetical protein ES703_62786 [subsurface metagenome]
MGVLRRVCTKGQGRGRYDRGTRVCFIVVLIGILYCLRCENFRSSDLILLSNDRVEVGILPEAGGRVVLLRIHGLKNVLKSDERLWHDPEKHKPEVSAFSDFKPFYGHIVWVGPQSEWWQHQDMNEIRRKTKAVWPPDPYLIYGKFEVIQRNERYIKMHGPASPVSGVRLLKEVSIDNSGRVTLTATAENIREENVSWDLWMNTRFDGYARGYIPVEENGNLELVLGENETREITPYSFENGYFTYRSSVPAKPRGEQVQEAHLYPSEGFVAVFSERQVILIRFEKLDRSLIHPQHGLVESYSYVNENGDDRLLEMEIHGAYRTLAPGDTMSLTETWELLPYDGNDDLQEHIKYLQNNEQYHLGNNN